MPDQTTKEEIAIKIFLAAVIIFFIVLTLVVTKAPK